MNLFWFPSVLLLLLLHCASGSKRQANTLISRYPGAGTLCLAKGSLIDGLEYQFHSFSDTTGKETMSYLWDICRTNKIKSTFYATTDPLIENIPVMACVLKNRGYSVGTIEPCTYEGIYALSKLPVLMWVLIIHYQNSQKKLITDKNLTISDTSLLSKYADELQLHLVGSIEKSGESYLVTTHDGTILHGLATDILNGQILSIEQNEKASYIQIVDCFTVTSLPLLECNEHLDEWYAPLHYIHKKPVVEEME